MKRKELIVLILGIILQIAFGQLLTSPSTETTAGVTSATSPTPSAETTAGTSTGSTGIITASGTKSTAAITMPTLPGVTSGPPSSSPSGPTTVVTMPTLPGITSGPPSSSPSGPTTVVTMPTLPGVTSGPPSSSPSGPTTVVTMPTLPGVTSGPPSSSPSGPTTVVTMPTSSVMQKETPPPPLSVTTTIATTTTAATTKSFGPSSTTRANANPIAITTKATTTNTPTTTPTTTTTTTAAAAFVTTRPQPTVDLNVGLRRTFVPALGNPQSNEFRRLASQVVQLCDLIFMRIYGSRFIRTIVRAFRPRPTRVDDLEAEVQLVFNENSTVPVPPGDEVGTALKTATENNSTLSALIDSTAITVINEPLIIPVEFQTNGTFVPDLANISSAASTTRSRMIKTGLNPFFLEDYPKAFTILTMSNFSNGNPRASSDSILNFMDLAFASSATLPNSTQIGETMLRAARSDSLPFKIFTDSIIVNGTLISSSDVSSKISVFLACFMAGVSLLFTRPS